jgi:hypothetical protein
MKQDLEVVRLTHPFELDTFNIREPPQDTPAEKAQQIEELYKNDIVSSPSACLRRPSED